MNIIIKGMKPPGRHGVWLSSSICFLHLDYPKFGYSKEEKNMANKARWSLWCENYSRKVTKDTVSIGRQMSSYQYQLHPVLMQSLQTAPPSTE